MKLRELRVMPPRPERERSLPLFSVADGSEVQLETSYQSGDRYPLDNPGDPLSVAIAVSRCC